MLTAAPCICGHFSVCFVITLVSMDWNRWHCPLVSYKHYLAIRDKVLIQPIAHGF